VIKVREEETGRVRSTGTKMNVDMVFVRRLGRSRRRWENNIKMDIREVGCGVSG
jgi:hypothetical protein